MVAVALQAVPADAAAWLDLARRAEDLGLDALLVPDHPGATVAPFVALGAAAAVTSRIGLGSYVTNGGVREPIHIATDVATLDLVSAGRARLGLGAGHTPAEWRSVGRERPDVTARVDRAIAVAQAVRALLAGEEVDVDGPGLTARAARLEHPRPVHDRIPLTIGTSNRRLLRFAGEHADVVGLSGLGKTLADGHRHAVRWTPAQVDEQVAVVRAAAAVRADPPQLDALVQLFEVTDDAEAVLAPLAEELGTTVADLRTVPYVLVGTAEDIVAAVVEHHRRWGITRYVVRAADRLDQLAGVLPALGAV